MSTISNLYRINARTNTVVDGWMEKSRVIFKVLFYSVHLHFSRTKNLRIMCERDIFLELWKYFSRLWSIEKKKCTDERFLVVVYCQRLFLLCFFHSRSSWQKKNSEQREIFYILLQIVHCLVSFSFAWQE